MAKRSVKTKADRFHALRANAGLSLEKLAAETDLGLRTVQKVSTGGPVDLATIRALADFFGVEPADLIDGCEDEPEHEEEAGGVAVKTKVEMVLDLRKGMTEEEALRKANIVLRKRIGTADIFEIRVLRDDDDEN